MRGWCLGFAFIALLAGTACGDDGDTDPMSSPGVEGGQVGSGDCIAGSIDNSGCNDCTEGFGRRTCSEDGTWGACECIVVDECLDAKTYFCPNPCPGDTDTPRDVGPCVDGKPPSCTCPEGGDGGDGDGDAEADAGMADAGAADDAGM